MVPEQDKNKHATLQQCNTKERGNKKASSRWRMHSNMWTWTGEAAASMVTIIYLKRFTSSKQRELTPYQRLSHVYPWVILLKVINDLLIILLIIIVFTSIAPIILYPLFDLPPFITAAPISGASYDWLIGLTFIVWFTSIKSISACQLQKQQAFHLVNFTLPFDFHFYE